MRARFNVFVLLVVLVVFAAVPSNAAVAVVPADQPSVWTSVREWGERLPQLVKRLLKFGPRTNGDHLSPPKP